jgi:hypothetical protein
MYKNKEHIFRLVSEIKLNKEHIFRLVSEIKLNYMTK